MWGNKAYALVNYYEFTPTLRTRAIVELNLGDGQRKDTLVPKDVDTQSIKVIEQPQDTSICTFFL